MSDEYSPDLMIPDEDRKLIFEGMRKLVLQEITKEYWDNVFGGPLEQIRKANPTGKAYCPLCDNEGIVFMLDTENNNALTVARCNCKYGTMKAEETSGWPTFNMSMLKRYKLELAPAKTEKDLRPRVKLDRMIPDDILEKEPDNTKPKFDFDHEKNNSNKK